MNKNKISDEILKKLQQELTLALIAADNAHKAATDDQSVAETQYDTLAIEAGYLAQGQAQRVEDIRAAIATFETLSEVFSKTFTVATTGALVQLEQDIKKNHYFLIAPSAGGYRCEICEDNQIYAITIVTPQAPMGAALMGKELDDEITVAVGRNILSDFITSME